MFFQFFCHCEENEENAINPFEDEIVDLDEPILKLAVFQAMKVSSKKLIKNYFMIIS